MIQGAFVPFVNYIMYEGVISGQLDILIITFFLVFIYIVYAFEMKFIVILRFHEKTFHFYIIKQHLSLGSFHLVGRLICT